jgi:transposase-like protein
MAKNKIQFQAGMSLAQFLSQYGTEDQCRLALLRMRWPQGFRCPECGDSGYCEIKSRKVFQCNSCHAQTSLIQGTLYASTKLPLQTWFLGIYFVTQSKDGISSLNLARVLGISANAALRMKHKLQQAMKERDDYYPLAGLVLLDDAYWGGKKRDGRRGRGATGKMPFIAALSITSEGHPLSLKLGHVRGFTKKEISSWSTKHLSPGSLIVSDGLNCFPAVTESACGHEPIPTSTSSEYDEFKVFKWVNTMIGNVKNAIHGTYHAISEKHFPRYLAEFCYRFNRRFLLHKMIDNLAYAAMYTPPMPQRILRLAEVRW